jgi:hypothetical protein
MIGNLSLFRIFFCFHIRLEQNKISDYSFIHPKLEEDL